MLTVADVGRGPRYTHAMPIVAPPAGFHGPVKRSITIAGHQTSISLEPTFWQALETAAVARNLPLSALVAAVDALRIATPAPPNLASALRSWLLVEMATATIATDCGNSEKHSQ